MSLSVNLILPSERRSGSKINTKSILRVLGIVLPLVLLVILFQQGLQYFVLQTNLRLQESRWQAAEPRQNYARHQLARLNRNMAISKELTAWRESSPAWDAVLLAIMQSTPTNIQIATLRMQAIPSPSQPPGGSPPNRRPGFLLEGRVREPNAMQAIETMRDALAAHAMLESALQTADVVNFAADPSDPGSSKRVFSLRIRLQDLPQESDKP